MERTLNTQLSPKDLALVIGVSESSLKRWVDEERLFASRTAGGHRRIALHEAIRFIRENNQSLSRPELLGLSDLSTSPMSAVQGGTGEVALLKALEAGQPAVARGLIIAHYLANRSVASVFDGPITHAMHRIGELWRHSESGIFIEHRATEIVMDAIHQIRQTLPPVPPNALCAIGSAAAGDPYTMPSLMASTTLLECGFQETNLGANLPVESLIAAAREKSPKLVWLAVSYVADRSVFIEGLQRLADALATMGSALVIGGRGVAGLILPVLPSTHVVGSMSELASFAKGLKADPRASHPRVSLAPAPGPQHDHDGHAPNLLRPPGRARPKH
jgi:methanogenic corrinoid protein MtbC1